MKRLAVLAAAVLGSAVHAAEPDPPPVPQLAPTLPQIPRPVLSGGDLRQGEAGRAELPPSPAPAHHHIRPTVKVGAGPDGIPAGLPPRGATGGAGTAATAAPPAPVVPSLPPPPVPDKPEPVPPAPAAPPTPSCGPEGCAGGHGGCWAHIKSFLCYRQSKVYFGLHPTPYYQPLHLLFPCHEKAPCGPGGCAVPGHPAGPVVGQDAAPAPAGAGTAPRVRPGLGSRLFNRDAVKPERGWATAGETIPGYRLAAPESPAITGQPPRMPPIVGTSYKLPADQR